MLHISNNKKEKIDPIQEVKQILNLNSSLETLLMMIAMGTVSEYEDNTGKSSVSGSSLLATYSRSDCSSDRPSHLLTAEQSEGDGG